MMACYPAASTTRILDQYACHAPVSPATTDAQPVTPKASFTASGQCARFTLRDDLTALMVDGAADPVTMATIVHNPVRG